MTAAEGLALLAPLLGGLLEALRGGDVEALRRLLPADYATSGDGVRILQAAERERAGLEAASRP